MFKKIAITLSTSLLLASCGTVDTIKKYWPRDHDPVMFAQLVKVDVGLDAVDCQMPLWSFVISDAEILDRYTTWRQDPQQENIHGLNLHIKKISVSKNPTFCDLGKKTAKKRIEAARSAWEGR